MTHTFNILQNSNLQLVAIVDKNAEQVPEKLQENLGNFSTGSLSQSDIANVKVYSDLAECLAAETPMLASSRCIPLYITRWQSSR